MKPLPGDVAAFIGQRDNPNFLALAESHLPIVTQMVKAYVRDRGFDQNGPGEDLAAVIVSATARLMGNPQNITAEQVDDFSVRRGEFNGWTLAELAILHRYRKRAM